jgi:hypothetical protein
MNAKNLTKALAMTVILPDFLSKQTLEEVLLKNAQPLFETSHNQFERTLFNLFQFDSRLKMPAAAITALGYGLPANQGGWLRADPVEIAVGAGSAYLVGNTHLQLTAGEMVALQALLGTLLAEDGLRLYMPSNHEWCLQLPEEPNIVTCSLSQTLGKAVRDRLPRGAEAKKWQMLLTEMQMLLFESTVNRDRAIRGQPLISSLWFWGEGILPNIRPPSRWRRVWSDSFLIKGLAIFTHTELAKLPQHFTACLAQMNDAGEYLIDLSQITAHFSTRVEDQLSEDVKNQWLNPILQALQTRELANVSLCLSEGSLYNLADLRQRWWRRIFNNSKLK